MKLHQLTIEEVLSSLKTSVTGLSSSQAEKRLSEFGPNTIKQSASEPVVLKFLRGFTHFFALILWCGAAIAFFAEWQQPGSGMKIVGWAILGVIFINGVFSFWQEYRAEQAIAALQKLIPHEVKVWRDGKLAQLASSGLVPGDVITVEAGDDIPSDCRLIEATALRVNNATMTGESLPQARNTCPSSEDELKNSKNVILAGTSVYAGNGVAVVFNTGMHSEFGKIAQLTQATATTLSPLQKEIVRLSKVIALIAVTIGSCFFVVGCSMGISLWVSAIFALGIIVALVPEGLLPEVTLSMATCSQRMAKRNALIRHLPSVETLGCATVICTDKTGTLTRNQMAVKELFIADSFIDIDMQRPTCPAGFKNIWSRVCEVVVNCETIKEVERDGKPYSIGDPMEAALSQFGKEMNEEIFPLYPRVDEVPFDADRKRLSTLHDSGNGLILYTKGALELIMPLCQSALFDSHVAPMQPEISQSFLQAQEMMTKRGLRVLALCYKEVPKSYDPDALETGLTLVGLIGLEDPPRPEVAGALKQCHQAGIRVIMVTGDHPNTAVAIAKETGLIAGEPLVICGPQLRNLSDIQLRLALDSGEIIFARVDADQKMRIVNSLKCNGHVVAVTGDGVNDAPALKAADIGIAMGLTGTDVARASADIVLADDNFASIVYAIEEGRGFFDNIRKFLTYVLSSNVAELVPSLAFLLWRIPLPLNVMQILSVDLGTDLAPALALGAEKPDARVMQQPPRSASDGLFDVGLLSRAYLFLGVMVSAASMLTYFLVLHEGGWRYGQLLSQSDPLYLKATTACLMGIMCMQAINSSLCRSERQSLFSLGPFSNKLLLLGLGLQFALMMFITYTPWGNAIFRTAPLPLGVWLFLIPFMLGMFFLEEFRKWWVRRISKKDSHISENSWTTLALSPHFRKR